MVDRSCIVFNCWLINLVKIDWPGWNVRHDVPESCRFCTGSGSVTVELGGGANEVSQCINCEGVGSFTCTTCQGSGIQPRYLDRRYRLLLPTSYTAEVNY